MFMDDYTELKNMLETVNQLIADATSRAMNLERAVGVLTGLGADTAAADQALVATYHLIGVHSKRRATLLKMIDGHRGGRASW